MYSCAELFLRSLKCYFGVYFPRCFATREIKHQNNPLMSTKTVRHSSTYIILYLYFALWLFTIILRYLFTHCCWCLGSLHRHISSSHGYAGLLVLVVHEARFHVPAQFWCQVMKVNVYIFLCFPHKFIMVMVNSLWLSDGIWRHRSGSTLAQVTSCCLTA